MKRTLLFAFIFTQLTAFAQQTAKEAYLSNNRSVEEKKEVIPFPQAACNYAQQGNNLEDGWGSYFNGNTIVLSTADVLDVPANETWIISSSMTRHFMPTGQFPTEIWVNVYADSSNGEPTVSVVDSMKSSNVSYTFLQVKFSLDVYEVQTIFNSGQLTLPGGPSGTRYWISFMTPSTTTSYLEFRYDFNYSNTTIYLNNGGTWQTNSSFLSCAYELDYTLQGAPVQDTICNGDSIQFGIVYVDSTGTYSDTLQSIQGCDSLAVLELYERPTLNVSMGVLAQDTVCVSWPSFVLPAGTPSGGTYSGPGVTDSLFDPNAAGVGTHTVYYTYGDSLCSESDSVTIYVDVCTGVGENGLNTKIVVFPNPVLDVVTIQSPLPLTSVVLYDILGQQLYIQNANNTTQLQLDMNAWQPGNYVLSITTTMGTVVHRLVK